MTSDTSDRQQQLFDSIHRAFDGVVLGAGTSMADVMFDESHGCIDNRGNENDERSDWQKLIHNPMLIEFCGEGYQGFCFFDALGLRFHLPALLWMIVLDPEGKVTPNVLHGLLSYLTDLDEFKIERLAILNEVQRACVRDVLIYMRDTEEWYEQLSEAIAGYWSEPQPPQ